MAEKTSRHSIACCKAEHTLESKEFKNAEHACVECAEASDGSQRHSLDCVRMRVKRRVKWPRTNSDRFTVYGVVASFNSEHEDLTEDWPNMLYKVICSHG